MFVKTVLEKGRDSRNDKRDIDRDNWVIFLQTVILKCHFVKLSMRVHNFLIFLSFFSLKVEWWTFRISQYFILVTISSKFDVLANYQKSLIKMAIIRLIFFLGEFGMTWLLNMMIIHYKALKQSLRKQK